MLHLSTKNAPFNYKNLLKMNYYQILSFQQLETSLLYAHIELISEKCS